MRSRCRSFLAVTVLLLPAVAAAETPAVSRSGIEQLQAQLDHAVGQVSRPSGGIVVGRAEGARGYHLPGYGAVFVLAPRALPRPRGAYVWSEEIAPGAVIQFEATGPTEDPRILEAEPKHPAPDRRIRIRTVGPPAPLDPEQARALAEVEAQVAAFQREAEEMRQEADREFERVVRDLMGQLPPPPAPPSAAVPAVPVEAPEAPRAVRPPTPPRPPQAPLPPPWRFWFESREARDARAPEEVVADVRSAVVATLEAYGALVSGLGPDEHLAVAVDFQPGGPFVSQARPTKTLVVRARRKDLDDRARGRLSPEELRKRMEVVEY